MQAVAINLGTNQIKFSTPSHWSINKLKCLLCCEIPKLEFNRFELKHEEELLEGSHRVDQIVEEKIRVIELDIVLKDSREKFDEFYSKTMKPFFRKIRHENLPVFSAYYQESFNKAEMLEYEPPNEDNEQNNDFNDEPMILRIFRLFGFYIMLGIVITFAELYQVGFMILIIGAYAIIEFYKNRNRQNAQRQEQQERQQPQRQQREEKKEEKQEEQMQEKNKQEDQKKEQGKIEQKKEEQITLLNKIKSQALLRCFKVAQIVFCFCVTFFPNWTIEMHLNMNANLIEKCRKMVESYNPKIMEGNEKQD